MLNNFQEPRQKRRPDSSTNARQQHCPPELGGTLMRQRSRNLAGRFVQRIQVAHPVQKTSRAVKVPAADVATESHKWIVSPNPRAYALVRTMYRPPHAGRQRITFDCFNEKQACADFGMR